MESFWRGPITSKGQANTIIRWTGWVFISLGVLPMLLSRSVPPGVVIFSQLNAALSVFLLWRRSNIAAWLLFLIVALATALVLFLAGWAIVYEVETTQPGDGVALGLDALVGALLSSLAWRAQRATQAWPGLRGSGSNVEAGGETGPLGPPWIT